MQKKYWIYLTMAACGLTNCKKELTQPIYGSQTASTFYKNTDQLSQALTAAYYSLRKGGEADNYGEYSLHFLLKDASTDDAEVGGGGTFPEWYSIQAFAVSSTNVVMTLNWEERYNSIYQCNLVIANAPEVPGDTALIGRMVNEAKFIRALDYYELATWYGDVPLILAPQAPADVFVTRTPQSKVLAQIEQDLKDASHLPLKSQYAATDNGRVTGGAALSLLGKLYMFQSRFTDAAQVLGTVVNSGEYHLVTDYGSLFTEANNNGPESVFEVQYTEDAAGLQNGGTQVVEWFASRITGAPYGYGFHCPTADLHNAFDPDDPRITYTFYQTGDRFKGDAFTQDCGPSTSTTGYHDRKMFIPAADRTSVEWDLGYNFHYLRYADVLLMYAEALNENGASAQALPYLEQVRNRARHSNPLDPKRDIQVFIPATNPATSLPPVNTTDQVTLRNVLWKERRLELGDEGWRRDDLIRQKRYGQVMRAYAVTHGTGNYKGAAFNDNRDYLEPVPQDEINRNSKLTQNPGY